MNSPRTVLSTVLSTVVAYFLSKEAREAEKGEDGEKRKKMPFLALSLTNSLCPNVFGAFPFIRITSCYRNASFSLGPVTQLTSSSTLLLSPKRKAKREKRDMAIALAVVGSGTCVHRVNLHLSYSSQLILAIGFPSSLFMSANCICVAV